MSKDLYLDKLQTMRQNSPDIMSPLFDFLEDFRPMENFDGDVEYSTEGIRRTLHCMVELEINDITTVMVQLGYKNVYFDYEYFWNMQRIVEERVSMEEV